jgi:glycine betaine/proline transport system substrate-binding protein
MTRKSLGILVAAIVVLVAIYISFQKPQVPETVASAECGRVTVANMNWQSAEVLAAVDKMILEKGYGCQVEVVPGDTMPTLTSMMEKGEPDVAPESWINSVREPLDAAVKEGRLHYAAKSLPDGGVEGWWIPKYIADANPGINTIDDALKRPDLFPAAEAKGKGGVHNCPSGWNCQLSTANAFKAWDAEGKGFVLIDTGSAAGLDGSIAKAFERKQGWLGYYWAPTSILGKYEMVKLDAGVPHDNAAWNACNAKANCADPKKNDWAVSEVYTVVTDRFKKAGGEAYNYLANRGWSNQTVGQLMAWMTDNQATGEDGAVHFLKTYPQVWEKWVSPAAAQKIKAAL